MLQECAEKFDSVEQPDNVTMDEISLKVFERADKLATVFRLKNTQRLVVAQKIANAIMRLASPVALDEEKYGKYADSYILSNDELLSKAGDYSDTSIEEAREELDVLPIANESQKNADEPIRENLGLKPEDLENPAPEQKLSAKANEVPVKENNKLAK